MTDALQRWTPEQLAPGHALPLARVLALLAESDERVAVERMLDLLRSAVDAGPAVALEVVLQGGALKLRQLVASAGAAGMDASGAIGDSAQAQLVTLARGSGGDAVLGLRRPAGGPHSPERLSVLYTLSHGTAWAMHLLPPEETRCFGADALSALAGTALLVREVHRIVSPSSTVLEERVDAAAIRLGVRATALSGRERQICARIAGGHSASSIAAELGIAASTVTTLRKRAYAKLGIHDRRDLRHLAA